MNLSRIFDTFSRRDTPPNKPDKALTSEFRYRLARRCDAAFMEGGIPSDFWSEINSRLEYLYGRQIARYRDPRFVADGVWEFLNTCSDKQFLDFVEQVFKLDAWTMNRIDGSILYILMKDVSFLFEVDDLPYALTDFSWEEFEDFRSGTPPQRLGGYPRTRKSSGETVACCIRPP